MKALPSRPHLGHLKKQAKELLAACRRSDRAASARMRAVLPAAAGLDDAPIAAMDLHLHDAQSCIAREYGFPSWALLKDYVDAENGIERRRGRTVATVEGVDVRRRLSQRQAAAVGAHPRRASALVAGDAALACAVGDVATVRRMLSEDSRWARTRGSSERLSPLQCACFSALIELPAFAQGIRECAALLARSGARTSPIR